MLVLNAIKTKNYTKTGRFRICEALAIGCFDIFPCCRINTFKGNAFIITLCNNTEVTSIFKFLPWVSCAQTKCKQIWRKI